MPDEIYDPSGVIWVGPLVSSQSDVPGTLLWGGVQEASRLDARTISTNSSRCEGAAVLPQAPNSFQPLVSTMSFVGHYPELMTVEKSRTNQPIDFSLYLILTREDPEILEPPSLGAATPLFQQRITASHLEVLIFIPANVGEEGRKSTRTFKAHLRTAVELTYSVTFHLDRL